MDLKKIIRSLIEYRQNSKWSAYHKTIAIALNKINELTIPFKDNSYKDAIASLYNFFFQLSTDNIDVENLKEILQALKEEQQRFSLKDNLTENLAEIKRDIHAVEEKLYFPAVKALAPSDFPDYAEKIIAALNANNLNGMMSELYFLHSHLKGALYTKHDFTRIPLDKFLKFFSEIFAKLEKTNVRHLLLLQDFVDAAFKDQIPLNVDTSLQTTLKLFCGFINVAIKPKETLSDDAQYIAKDLKEPISKAVIKHAIKTVPLKDIPTYVKGKFQTLDTSMFTRELYAYEMGNIDDVLADQLIVQKKLFIETNKAQGLNVMVHIDNEKKMKSDIARMLLNHIQDEIFTRQWGKEGSRITIKENGKPLNKVSKDMLPVLDAMEKAMSDQLKGIDSWEQTLNEVRKFSKKIAGKYETPSCFSACFGRKENPLVEGFFGRLSKGVKLADNVKNGLASDPKQEVEMAQPRNAPS